jgi:hypothetical protein
MSERQTPSQYFAVASRAKRNTTTGLVSVRLPDDLLRRLAEVGNEQGLAMSDTIRLVLERGLAASPPKRRKANK